MADTFQLEQSKFSQGDESPFASKTYSFINDTNSGSYASNEVTFDLGQLYNSQKLIPASEMMLELPIVAVLSHNSANIALNASDFAFGLKNGYHSLVNGMSVEIDGQSVEPIVTNKCMYTSFKLISSMSANELKSSASSRGYYPDTATSWGYNASQLGTGQGNGLVNNYNCSAPENLSPHLDLVNDGLMQRQLITSMNSNIAKQGGLISEPQLAQSGRSYTKTFVSPTAGTHASDYQVYYFIATIKLSDISSFFEKLPLVKGLYGLLRVRLNLGTLAITRVDGTVPVVAVAGVVAKDLITGFGGYPAVPAVPAIVAVPAVQSTMSCLQSAVNISSNVCPFMITSIPEMATAIKPTGWTPLNGQNTFTVGMYIGKVVGNQSALNVPPHATFTACRLTYPIVELQPHLALDYFTHNANKTVEYDSLQYYVINSVAGSSQFRQVIANSTINATGVLVIPMLSQAGNAGIYPYSSPFTTEPCTSSPVGFTNYQVEYAGQSIYPSNMLYDYKAFQQELALKNTINGNLDLGMGSGLISQRGFEQGNQKYYYTTLRTTGDNVSSKGITISGTMNCSPTISVDLHCFIITKKQVVINVQTGRMVV